MAVQMIQIEPIRGVFTVAVAAVLALPLLEPPKIVVLVVKAQLLLFIRRPLALLLLATFSLSFNNMKTIHLSTETVNAVLQYLGNRPYVEVANLILAIQKEAEKSIVEEKKNGMPE